jgi:hypothetical protein
MTQATTYMKVGSIRHDHTITNSQRKEAFHQRVGTFARGQSTADPLNGQIVISCTQPIGSFATGQGRNL